MPQSCPFSFSPFILNPALYSKKRIEHLYKTYYGVGCMFCS